MPKAQTEKPETETPAVTVEATPEPVAPFTEFTIGGITIPAKTYDDVPFNTMLDLQDQAREALSAIVDMTNPEETPNVRPVIAFLQAYATAIGAELDYDKMAEKRKAVGESVTAFMRLFKHLHPIDADATPEPEGEPKND